MSTNEMECKARELRQLQALIDEATAEAEAIKDALKAAMGDAESVQAGEYKSRGRPSRARELTQVRCVRRCRTSPQLSPRKAPCAASVWRRTRRERTAGKSPHPSPADVLRTFRRAMQGSQ